MPSLVERLARINRYLPEEAKLPEGDGGYDWTDEYIVALLAANGYTDAQAVRFFWYQRVQETAEYLDMSKPLTQIHEQARNMLKYWDMVVQTNPAEMEPIDPALKPKDHRMITFGTIERAVTRP